MTTSPKPEISFSLQMPSHDVLGQFFHAPKGTPLKTFFKQMVAFKPHPALQPVWAHLESGTHSMGIATLYLPPRDATVLSAPVFIGNFVIGPHFQNVGNGRYLLQALEAYCRKQGFMRLALEFNPDSIGFWQAMGFEKSSQYQSLLFKKM